MQYATRLSSSLIVHTDHIVHNVQELRRFLERERSSSEVLAMIKADAYGHGLLPIYQALKEKAEVRSFGLANLGGLVS